MQTIKTSDSYYLLCRLEGGAPTGAYTTDARAIPNGLARETSL
jgi:hypothetical protein